MFWNSKAADTYTPLLEVYRMLERHPDIPDRAGIVNAAGLKKQLGREFGVDVDEILKEMGLE